MHMRTFRLRICLAFVLLPFLGGCQSSLVGPIKLGSSSHVEFQDESKEGLTGEATVALLKQGIVGVVVGWEHSFKTGVDSKELIYNRIYRGAVKFDVDLLSKSQGKTVTKATFNYAIKDGARSSSKGSPASCVTKLLLATEDWHGIPEMDVAKAPDTIAGDLYKDGLPEKPVGSVISVDVTDAVQAWVDGTKTNHGFVFAASKEEKGLIKDSEKCWTLLDGFSLRVNFSK
ncbi:DNRLRE domain-containing protein [Candidatus Methylomirabilis sp.]|uniref:DNRLRE domain-containing protein n=1 Tax=Candidatus Methylomirabilis sp. TaxID=2032687 RepID=UPI002A60629A|nr:DNRLRE domain-containing protein [Candidatus Methylomirabilis sp.]